MDLLILLQILLLAFGIFSPAFIVILMLLRILSKKCSLCGAKMEIKHGEGIVSYACKKCKNFEIKVLK